MIRFKDDNYYISSDKIKGGFPGGSVVKNLTADEGDTGLNPGLERPL